MKLLKKSYKSGGRLIPKHQDGSEVLRTSMLQKHKSNAWWKNASGRTELTDSPIDMVLLSGPAKIGGKAAGALANFFEKKSAEELAKVIARKPTNIIYEPIATVLNPILKTAQHAIPAGYWGKQGLDFLGDK